MAGWENVFPSVQCLKGAVPNLIVKYIEMVVKDNYLTERREKLLSKYKCAAHLVRLKHKLQHGMDSKSANL